MLRWIQNTRSKMKRMKIEPQVYVRGSEEAVRRAYDVLREGGTVIDPLGPCPWNLYCSNLIDRFGVFWWIAI